MADKRLVIVLEGTAAMGPYWTTILTDYVEKIIRYFCGNEWTGQESTGAIIELGLVMFYTHGPYSGCSVQTSGWTRDMDKFLQWLSSLSFGGGGYSDAAVAEGLADALVMFPTHPNGSQTQRDFLGQRHCILVAASNPFPLPRPVHLPNIENLECGDYSKVRTQCRLADAETVAKSFTQCFVSLSVISPKKLPKLREIYNAGNRNPQAEDPSVNNVKNPHFLVLLSENFLEARAAFNQHELIRIPSIESLLKMETDLVPPVSEPISPTLISEDEFMMLQQIKTEPVMSQQESPSGNHPTTTVKMEPDTVTSMALEPAFPCHPYVPHGASKSGPSLQTSLPSLTSQKKFGYDDIKVDLKSRGNVLSQNVCPVSLAAVNASIPSNITQARQGRSSAVVTRGNPSVPQTMGSHQTMLSPTVISEALVRTPRNAQNTSSGSFISADSTISGSFKISQPLANLQGPISMSQSPPSVGQGNISGAQIAQDEFGFRRNIASAFGQSSISSGVGTVIPMVGMSQQLHEGMRPVAVKNTLGTDTYLSQQTPSTLQEGQNRYVKAWEGVLTTETCGTDITFLCKLVAYRKASSSEMLAINWPQTLQVSQFLSRDFINSLPYNVHVDYLVFEAMNRPRVFYQMKENSIFVTIRLPSQTLILTTTNEECRFIGILYPGDFHI